MSFFSLPALTRVPKAAPRRSGRTWSGWRRHFEREARRPLPLRLRAGERESRRLLETPAEQLGALLRCLAVFQKGEAGEGRIAREIDRARFAWIDDDYRRSLKYFVAEEGRHARLLAILLLGLGGRVLRNSRTAGLFVLARRLLGLRPKLLVLAAAEIAGIVMYTLFARRLPPGVCRDLLREIAGDERAHLRFHAAFFRGWLEPCETDRTAAATLVSYLAALSFRLVWRVLVAGACTAMVFALRRELRLLGLSRLRIFALFALVGLRLERAIFR